MVPRARSKFSTVVAVLCVPILLGVCGAVTASAQTPMRLGVYLTGGGGDASKLDDYASMVGRNPDILLVFRSMDGPLLYSSEVSNLRARGETPMVTLEPYTSAGVASFSDIAAGKYDSYFRKEADAVKGLGMTVMLRFAHEMNLLSSDWGPGKAGNVGSGYVDAWRHIVTVFREEGAGNVEWVWAPNVDYGGRPFAQFFPGDEWVDYVALDGYNWGASSGGSWETFSKIFGSSYATLTELSGKPVIISETGSDESGGNKAAWIEESFLSTIPQKMPRVSAVVWFNDDKERDWRVNSSQASLDAYRRVVGSTLYGGDQAVAVVEEAPIVKDLDVVPKVTPTVESAPAPGPTATPAADRKGSHRHRRKHRRRLRLRGRITYRLSRRATVRIALHRRQSRSDPLVFTAEQRAGHKRVALSRLVGERNLRRGTYRVSVVAFSSGGNRSRPRHRGFRIVPPAGSRRG